MPEMHFTVRWPDDSVSKCYSPSLVIKDYFEVGQSYPIDDFVQRSQTSLNIASERVREKFGFACSSAMDQLHRIESKANTFKGQEAASVLIEGFDP